MRAALDALTGIKPDGGFDLRQLRLYQEVYGDLGNVCLQRGKHAEARKFFEDQAKMGEGLKPPRRRQRPQRRALAGAYLQLAEARLRDGDADLALARSRDALTLLRNTRWTRSRTTASRSSSASPTSS